MIQENQEEKLQQWIPPKAIPDAWDAAALHAWLIHMFNDDSGLEAASLAVRIHAALAKYVLKDSPAAGAAEIDQFVDGLRADDLCLVVACEHGDEGAWAELFEGYGATVRSAARAASSNEDGAEDLAQSIWAELHGLKRRADGQPAGKLGYYSGAGSLGGWLRAVVGQLAIDRHRREALRGKCAQPDRPLGYVCPAPRP